MHYNTSLHYILPRHCSRGALDWPDFFTSIQKCTQMYSNYTPRTHTTHYSYSACLSFNRPLCLYSAKNRTSQAQPIHYIIEAPKRYPSNCHSLLDLIWISNSKGRLPLRRTAQSVGLVGMVAPVGMEALVGTAGAAGKGKEGHRHRRKARCRPPAVPSSRCATHRPCEVCQGETGGPNRKDIFLRFLSVPKVRDIPNPKWALPCVAPTLNHFVSRILYPLAVTSGKRSNWKASALNCETLCKMVEVTSHESCQFQRRRNSPPRRRTCLHDRSARNHSHRPKRPACSCHLRLGMARLGLAKCTRSEIKSWIQLWSPPTHRLATHDP